MGESKRNNRKIGTKYEQNAIAFLKKKGYHILNKNFFCKFGEIDIVAQDNEYLVFVEVKYRSNSSMGLALESITTAKRQKLIKTAEYYLYVNKRFDCPCRFDVIAFDNGSVQHIENAFE